MFRSFRLRRACEWPYAWLLATLSMLSGANAAEYQSDVVVYGGTAGGAIAAVAAANEGMSVALLEPRRHIGGMVSGGLGRTDFGRKEVIGGMSREFFERVGKHYNEPIAWYFEPHVAEDIFRSWLKEAGVKVFFEQRVDKVRKDRLKITSLTTVKGDTFSAKLFLDASYEGDLLPRAGISYTWGREGRDKYGESLAGKHEHSPKHQFDVRVSPYDEKGRLLPLVYGGDPGKTGEGDKKVQAYNLRLCLTDRKDNGVAFPRPKDYDPKRYELLKRYLAVKGKDLKLGDLILIARMPNDKTDMNNNGPISTDHIGASWEYPEADYEKRQAIWDDHISYTQGFFYFLANDPSVPKHLHDEINKWGLAKDEFVDTDHWPHQLYIREARRMIGEYVMIQSDLQTSRTKPDSIGMGSYNSDSHNVQRIPTRDGAVENEGDMQVPVQPYEIAYRALTPKRSEGENLLVTGCVSASHVAYSSIRMEPVYMIMGHSAGVAAAWAVKHDAPVQKVDIRSLQERLHQQKQILSLADQAARFGNARSFPGIVVDNDAAQLSGEWLRSASILGFVGADYLHDDNKDKGNKTARFVPNLPSDGEYEVRVSYTPNPNRAMNVPIKINTAGGVKTVTLNQKKAPAEPPFASLGKFPFKAGSNGYVEIGTTGTDGHVVVDAVQWVAQKP